MHTYITYIICGPRVLSVRLPRPFVYQGCDGPARAYPDDVSTNSRCSRQLYLRSKKTCNYLQDARQPAISET